MTKSLWTLAALVLTVSSAAVVRNIRASQSPAHAAQESSQQKEIARKERVKAAMARAEKRRYLKAIPLLITETPSLQIIGAEIVPYGWGDGLRLTLQNKSDKAVESFTFCTSIRDDFVSSETIAHARGTIIEPYGEVSTTISSGNIRPDMPLTLCAMIFVDGTQEGLPRVLEYAKKDFEERKKRHERKEKP